jgi:MSHA pilin protein MshA
MRRKRGFTLIELIIVIVTLVVLSVTAAPHFIDLGTDARIAKLEAFEGSMLSASVLVNYKARIENKTDCDTDPTIEVQGEAITLRCGFPCPHTDGIANAVDAEEGFNWWGGNCEGVQGSIDVQITDAPDPSTCKIRYAAARSEDSSPIFIVTTNGC